MKTEINYEITVDVSNCSIATKKQVEEAYAKLGINWEHPNTCDLTTRNITCYTNRSMCSDRYDILYWSNNPMLQETRTFTHTVEQLINLAYCERIKNIQVSLQETIEATHSMIVYNENNQATQEILTEHLVWLLTIQKKQIINSGV